MATRRQPVPVLLAYDIDPSWEQADLESVLDELRDMWRSLEQAGHAVVPVPVGATGVRDALAPFEPDRFVVLNWIESLPGVRHGDVIAAAELEEAGYTYTGPAPQTIALSWDKPRVKRVLERAGVATPRWRLCSTPADVSGWDRFPAIVKPAYEHCSIGVTRLAVACSADELAERVGFVLGDLRQPALVEEFIDGREFHVGLWGDRMLHVLPAAEMDFSAFAEVRDRLCTFDSKFSPGSPAYELTRVNVPAALSPRQLADLERAVVGAFRAVGCRDYARMDVRLDGDTFHVVDVNPNPDISSDTSIAAAAAAAGMPHGDLASRIVMLAARRHPVFRALARAARTARTLAQADDAV